MGFSDVIAWVKWYN